MMTSFVVPGTRLHPSHITMAVDITASKLYDKVSKTGSKLPLKNELMTIMDTVTTKRKLRVQWTIGKKPYVSEHRTIATSTCVYTAVFKA